MSHIINNNLSSPRTENKKRSTGALLSRSKPLGTLNSARRPLSIPPSKCSICEKKNHKHSHNLITITHKTLYTKYASSQNYYYTKDINELLSDSHTPVVILHKDLQTFDESEEYLKRLYKSSEYQGKIKLLAEYYKFHWDIPRLFMMPITEVVNRYHDRKRRLQYLKVTKMLKDQKESKNPTIKRDTEHKQKVEEPKPMSIADKLLVGLETSHSIIKQEAQRQQDENGARTLRGQGGDTQRRTGNQVREGGLREQRQKKEEEDAHKTTFNTLHDLNLKLGEIVSNSQVRLADTNYFDNNGDQSLNESLSNLKNFLNYLQTNTGSTNVVPQPMSEITKIAQQQEVQQARPVLVESVPVKRTATMVKSMTPRLEKPTEEDVEQKQGLRSTRAPVIAWNRADSTPMITPSPSEMARRGSAEAKEVARVEEKAKETGHGGNYGGLGHMSTAQSSLSSTMTSKSKSVYSSVTKIRNFEEAVKISQQGSQLKVMSPGANKPVLLRVNPSGSQQEMGLREASPSTEFVYKGMDSSIKTPVGFSEDKSKESTNKETMSPVSKHSSQLITSTTSGSKPGTRLMTAKNMTISSTRTMEGFMPRSPDMMSPTNQSPNFRIKSHREAGTSFDKNAQNIQQNVQQQNVVQNVLNIQSPSGNKQVPQIQMPSGRGHTRFGSGTFASPSGKTSVGKLGTQTMTLQSGRELKNLVALGALDVPIKEIKAIPNSASRKSDSKAEGAVAYSVKGSEGSATDREREAPPLSPKISTTPRGKLISHKHTRSEGGKLFKLDQLDMGMGSLNEQKIKELMRLSDVGSDVFNDCSQKLKKGEGLAKKMGSYGGGNNNNIANLVMSSHREMPYEGVPSAPGSKKQVSGSNGALISNRSTKPDVIVRKKSQLKKGEVPSGAEGKMKKPPSPGLVLDKFDEPRLGKAKALTVKGSGSFTPSSFVKGTVQPKGKGKHEFF